MKRTTLKREKKKPEEAKKKKAAVKKSKTGQTIKSKPEKKLRILILEDNPADAELMERQLRRDRIAFTAQRTETRTGFIKAIRNFEPDLVLADYTLPDFDAMRALALARKLSPFIPFIVITGSIGEERAVACLRAGANDYLLKDRLTRLGESVRHALAIHRLQSEKMAAEESLRSNELLYHAFINSSSDMAFLKDKQFRHLLANRELCRFYKKAEKEIIGKTDAQLLDKGAAARCRRTDRQALTANRVHVSEETVGNLTFETRKFPVKLKDNRIGVGGYIRNISERKRNEEALFAAAVRWRTTFDSMSDAVCLLDEKGAVRQCNQAMKHMLDIPYTKIIGKDCLSLVCGVRKKSTCSFHLLLKDGKRHKEETFWRQRWFQVTADPILGNDGRVLGAVHIMADITRRKESEDALREMNEIFRLFLKHNPIYVFIKDENIRPIYLSENYEKMLKRPLAEMLGKNMNELFPSALSRSMVEDDKRILREGRPCEFVEELEGRVYSTLKFPIFIQGKAKYLAGYTTDITERKQAADALRESEERFANLFQRAPLGYQSLDAEGRFLEVNEAWLETLGYRRQEVIGKWFGDFLAAEFVAAFRERFPLFKAAGSVQTEFEMIHKNGQRKTIAFEGRVGHHKDGSFEKTHCILKDISDRKQAEIQARRNEARLRSIVDILQHPSGSIQEFLDYALNQAIQLTESRIGYIYFYSEDDQRFTLNTWSKEVMKECAVRDPQSVYDLKQTGLWGEAVRQRRPILVNDFQAGHPHKKGHPEGHVQLQRFLTVPVFSEQRIVAVVGVANKNADYDDSDVLQLTLLMDAVWKSVQLKKGMDSLQRSENLLNKIFDTLPVGLWLADGSGKLVRSNPAGRAIWGSEPLVGSEKYGIFKARRLPAGKEIAPDDWALAHTIRDKVTITDEMLEIDAFDGTKKTILNYTAPVLDPSGNVEAAVVVNLDISERQQIEAELKESENRYRNHFENSSEFYFTLDLKGNFVDVNKAAVTLTGHAKSELLKMNFMDYTPKRDHRKLFLALAKLYKTGEPIQNLLIEAIMKDKSIKFFETNFSLLKDGEQIVGVHGSSKDVTERKRDEEQIHASLREKEVLLKEIHHRVKNNLQVISGLLTLQAQQIDDERLQHVIKDSQNRIWTMALIHQTLYQSGNLADIDMADYIRGLAGNLLSSHARVTMPPTVIFDLLPLRLSIDKAIPLALVLNELVTNAMKHAFADGRPGEIRISLQERRGVKFYAPSEDTGTARRAPTDHEPPATYELTVSDNGVGLPEGFDPQSLKSLGLQLVAMLSRQLDAALAFESAGGTIATITFHCHEKS